MRGITEWFVHNPIAAKLLTLLILLAGLLTFNTIDREFFPAREIDLISVTVTYPGAGPDEVEQQISARIEEAVDDIGGIEEVRSESTEGVGVVTIEVAKGENTQRILNDVKANVDAINTFPADAERPQIVERRWKGLVMRLSLSGNIDEASLKELGERVREELAALDEVDLVELQTPRQYELAIEVDEDALLNYGLSFEEVAAAVKAYSLNMPGGKIRDEEGDILLQTRAQAYDKTEFEGILVRSTADGASLRVGDVARVIEGFEEVDIYNHFNDAPALDLVVYSQESPNILKTSEAVRAYVEKSHLHLPPQVELNVWVDLSINYRGRLHTLINNGGSGLLLVFAVLWIFLRPSLAFWVCSGIAVAFLGAIWAVGQTAVSLNILSMFAFIMILGIVVDDAIIVGESVHTYQEQSRQRVRGAIDGTLSVMSPVWFAVVSTIVFFIPFFFLGDGPEASTLAIPVVLALFFSLFESLLLLPSHLADDFSRFGRFLFPGFIRRAWQVVDRKRQSIAIMLPRFASTIYRQFLVTCLVHRLFVLLLFAILFTVSVSIATGRWLGFSFFPRVPSDYISATVTMPESAPYKTALAVMSRIDESVVKLQDSVNTEVGYRLIQNASSVIYGTTVRVSLAMDQSNERPLSSREMAKRWRSLIGEIPEAREFSIVFTIRDIGKPITLRLKSRNAYELEKLSQEVRQALSSYSGIENVRSSLEEPSNEIQVALKPGAEIYDLTLSDIARQVRQAFYGEEVQRIPQEREDVKVLVRYPKSERSKEETIALMHVRDQQGVMVPIEHVAELRYADMFKKIERSDGMRVAEVTADIQSGYSAELILQELVEENAPRWLNEYPESKVIVEGEQKEQAEFIRDLFRYMSLSMIAIFGLMAIMFRSYWEPVLVLTAVPFGYMGAVFGHVIMGLDLSMFSFLGMMACAGVVVNDNVVLIDRVNQLRRKGWSQRRSVINAAIQRFRPIVLTSITTFIGLSPILFETSVQAQFLKPMVVSLSFGVLFATGVTLIFVPILYLFGHDVARRLLPRSEAVRLADTVADV